MLVTVTDPDRTLLVLSPSSPRLTNDKPSAGISSLVDPVIFVKPGRAQWSEGSARFDETRDLACSFYAMEQVMVLMKKRRRKTVQKLPLE
jgi:hypothetical protein